MTAKFQLRNDTVVLTDSEEGSDEGMIIYEEKSVIIRKAVLFVVMLAALSFCAA
jgi:hypothetical protein